MSRVDHIAGRTFHGRHGAVRNAFTYGIDYVLLDAEGAVEAPRFFARNGRGLMGIDDSDHGGPPGAGRGAAWVRAVLEAHQIGHVAHRIELLAQPSVLGHVFNPVSFWLIRDDADALRAVIAEVTNTFGDRHCYLCRHPDLRTIRPRDILRSEKIFHVSPFQDVEGGYSFRFDIGPDEISVVIDYRTSDDEGVIATLRGTRKPLSNIGIVAACLRRPLGSRRVLGLIHWQALKLWWKGARYRSRPRPPDHEIS
ncbi:DUF1365 domain-containing protein [Maribius pontilimi]|uniref:DUF1365 domain-containing protein n=1 Tax=Palleronia pontilimi TaxID=1964209 RepID=A0A934MDN8_9RHOB|nr:DUF1365 domain-containing protein [Palleronia pontilimi]